MKTLFCLSYFTAITLAAGPLAPLLGQATNASATPSPASAAGSSSALVSNPDFSLATIDPAWPDDWGKGAGITWETEGGKHFLRLVATEPGKMLMAYREVDIPVGVKKVQITIRFRSSGIVTGEQNYMDARGIFHFLDATHKVLPGDPNSMDFTNTASGTWNTLTEEATVPDGAVKLALMPSLFKVAAGTLDLAEVSAKSIP
jgi:hypothetical protein